MRRVILLLWLCLLAACTIVPRPIVTDAPSWDGDQQDSGIITVYADGTALVTSHFRDRYNGMISRYGKQFTPRLQKDAGLRPGNTWDRGETYLIDAEHLADFALMNAWRKANRNP